MLRERDGEFGGICGLFQEELGLSGREFALGKTGGMIGRSNYFDVTLDSGLQRIAPRAKLEILSTPLVEVAARRALSL